MAVELSSNEASQLMQTIEMFEVITQSQPQDYQSLEILKEAYMKLGRQADVVGTSKRIAQAYVQQGQLSSAILEYESILQLFPDDPDVQAALEEIEDKANRLSARPPPMEVAAPAKPSPAKSATAEPAVAAEVEDGRQAMYALLVGGKMVSAADFNLWWKTPPAKPAPTQAIEPFLQVLADKGIMPIELSLKAVCEKSRLSYLPIERYDMDVETARSFPREVCQRWCVLPFDRMSQTVLVATANPFNQQAAHELAAATPHRLLWYLSSPAELCKALHKVFR